MKEAGSSSHFPPASFLHKEHMPDVSALSLLQRMAKNGPNKKNLQEKTLNERSETELPMDPNIKSEMEAFQKHLELASDHIKITGESSV